MTSALRWDGWSAPRPGRFTPGKDPVPIARPKQVADSNITINIIQLCRTDCFYGLLMSLEYLLIGVSWSKAFGHTVRDVIKLQAGQMSHPTHKTLKWKPWFAVNIYRSLVCQWAYTCGGGREVSCGCVVRQWRHDSHGQGCHRENASL